MNHTWNPIRGPRGGHHRGHLGTDAGRGVARLLADFGHDLPSMPASGAAPKETRLFRSDSGSFLGQGPRRAGRGWAPASAPVSTWRMTSDQAPVLWPFIAAPGLPPTGAQMGVDLLSGGCFYADPLGWVLSDDVPVTNPNIFSFGKPGRGKSATTKAFCLRMTDFGYRILVLGDPKDEYEGLCRFFGVEPVAIGHGLPTRINPLAFGPLLQGWDDLSPAQAQGRAAVVFGRWLTLIRGLVGSQRIGEHRVPFGPTDEVVTKAALAHLTGYAAGHTTMRETTIPQLWHLLDTPTPELIAQCRYANERHFLDSTRLLRDALSQLVGGALAGLFDDHTTIDVDWAAPIQSLSLSRLEALGDDAVGIALTCLNSWGRGMREMAPPGDLRVVVRDESWKQLRLGPEALKSFDADLRLSRRDGDIQFAVAHKPSDLLSAGDAGSQAVAIAKDLLHLADITILHGQDVGVARELESLLGLRPMARDLVTGWAMQGKGRALWCVGEQHYKVQTILHPIERELTFTNQAITSAA
ncbi:ATP-binding protein [Dermatophilaceae bacterium Soc4.6]